MRGRAVLLITTIAVALLVASGVALAAEITCPNRPPTRECVGTRNADTMTGTPQRDEMSGMNGGDTMLALGGADTLLGGKGDDFLSGENGNDTYHFSTGWGADRIPADGEGSGMGTDTLEFHFSLVDGLFAEPLDIDLDPSADRDEVFTLFSDAGKQTLNFPAAVEIENVTGGTARDVIRGNDLANSLSGYDGNDTLAGRSGVDVLSGGLGTDDLNGGLGNDKLNGGDSIGDGVDSDAYLFQDGWGKDEITDDIAGIDRLSFGQLTSPVTVNLTASDTGPPEVCSGNPCDPNPVNTVDWGTTVEIENATGGDGDDKLTGNSSANKLYGQSGNDEMYGEGSADEMYGRDGNDTMFGGPDVDRVYGDHPDFPTEIGDDRIDVKGGNIIGDTGNTIGDTVDCGPGSNDVVFYDVGTDTIDNCEIPNPPSSP